MSRVPDFAVVSRRVLTEGGLRPAAVLVAGERIAAVVPPAEIPPGCPQRDFGDHVVMAGLVDSHVHINEPGRTEWEGFWSATRAAAAGGVTTLVDMPLNSIPPTTTRGALQAKRDAARDRLFVDCGFWGGVVPGNTGELEGMVEEGVCGFKAFLVPSGVDEFPPVDEADLRLALLSLTGRGAPLLAHAEIALPVADAGGDARVYSTYLSTRPASWENEAIRLLIRLGRDTEAAIHVVHLSSAEALADIEAARARGLRLTTETCPHYLALAAETVPAGRTEWKCSPPIREQENQERLWTALRQGVIDMVVSDHSPCVPERKGLATGDFLAAWGGIASLQLRLPVVWTEARRRGGTIEEIARWLCERPAELAGFAGRKGRLAPGYDADLVAWNPEAVFEVRPDDLHHRHKLTPYAGRELQGVVEATFLRGTAVWDGGEFSPLPQGRALRRGLAHG
jgi:allantoinase